MISKEDAAAFLQSLAKETSESQGARLILVRSTQQTKTFVAHALEQLETIEREFDSNPQWSTDRLDELASEAQTLGSLQVSTGIERLSLIATLTERSRKPGARDAFARALRALSAMLLRLYVQGHDRECTREASALQSCLETVAPGSSLTIALTDSSCLH